MAHLSPHLSAAIATLEKSSSGEIKTETLVRAALKLEEIFHNTPFPSIPSLPTSEYTAKVFTLLSEYCRDIDALTVCLLLPVYRHPSFPLTRLKHEYGAEIEDLLRQTYLLLHIGVDQRHSIDDVQRMFTSVAQDPRVLLIVLAHKCITVSQVECMSKADAIKTCREALSLHAPLAARLGIYAMKYRLEDRAFPIVYPNDHERILGQLELLHTSHGEFLQSISDVMMQYMKTQGLPCKVSAREKHPYSIFQKMNTRSFTTIESLIDLIAVRIIVADIPACYQALGLVHQGSTPLSHRFKDYIAFPKPNGYQSLHTCVLGLPGAPKNLKVEVQIRTADMHKEAEYGIAAHWLYKRQPKSVALQRSSKGNGTLASPDPNISIADRIYVLTPKGNVLELPEGATPLDFAFAIHTDLGLKYKAAQVNGIAVPLTYKLENGDIVDVAIHAHPRPSLQWMEVLKSSSARAKLKAYMFTARRAEFIDRGKATLNADLRSRKLPTLDNDLSLLKTFDGVACSMREREDILVKIGMGSVRVSTLFRHFSLPSISRKAPSAKTKKKDAPLSLTSLILHEGHSLDMPYRFAKCCSPDTLKPRLEGIVGFITRSGDISVHTQNCRMVRSANPHRKVELEWGA